MWLWKYMHRHLLSPRLSSNKWDQLFILFLFTQGPFDYEDHSSQSPLSGTLEISLPTGTAGDSDLEEETLPKSFLKNVRHLKFFVFWLVLY